MSTNSLYDYPISPPAWIDIPNDDYALLSQTEDNLFLELNILVKTYHDCDKSSFDALSPRISYLKNIQEYLESWLKIEKRKHVKNFLTHISSIANNKQWYLENLENIYQEQKYTLEHLKSIHLCVETELKKGQRPIFLHNSRLYDSLTGQYWGEFWIETLDPCHRQLTTYYDLWRDMLKTESNLPPFFLWLEKQNLSRDILYLKFLEPDSIEECKVLIDQGKFFGSNGKIIDCCDRNEEFIFNIDLRENIYLTKASKLIHHVSLSHGKPVLGAGNILVEKGLVKEIGLESGHYLPDVSHGVQIIRILETKGLIMHDDIKIKYYHEHECCHESLRNFMNLYSKIAVDH